MTAITKLNRPKSMTPSSVRARVMIPEINPIEQFNPFRSPRWRYERVLELVDRPGRTLPFSRLDDVTVRRARNFFILWRRGRRGNEMDLSRAFCEDRGMYYAFLLDERHDEDIRKFVEARLLAGQSDEEIADKLCTVPEAIDAYEKLFFNVRDRLEHHDWIVRQIITPAASRFSSEEPLRNHELTLKFFGYFAGSVVLDAIISGWGGFDKPQQVTAIGNMFDKQMLFSIRQKSAAAARVFEVNRYNVMQLFETHGKLIELERNSESAGQVKSAIEQNIMAMVSEVQWTAGSIDSNAHRTSGSMLEFDGMAAELRDDELMEVAAGGRPTLESMRELKSLTISDVSPQEPKQ